MYDLKLENTLRQFLALHIGHDNDSSIGILSGEHMRRKQLIILGLVFSSIIMAGCISQITSVAVEDLVDNPGAYSDKRILTVGYIVPIPAPIYTIEFCNAIRCRTEYNTYPTFVLYSDASMTSKGLRVIDVKAEDIQSNEHNKMLKLTGEIILLPVNYNNVSFIMDIYSAVSV